MSLQRFFVTVVIFFNDLSVKDLFSLGNFCLLGVNARDETM